MKFWFSFVEVFFNGKGAGRWIITEPEYLFIAPCYKDESVVKQSNILFEVVMRFDMDGVSGNSGSVGKQANYIFIESLWIYFIKFVLELVQKFGWVLKFRLNNLQKFK